MAVTQIEIPILNFDTAVRSKGSPVSITEQKCIRRCENEIQINGQNRVRFICQALLRREFFGDYYEACQYNGNGCPISAFKPVVPEPPKR